VISLMGSGKPMFFIGFRVAKTAHRRVFAMLPPKIPFRSGLCAPSCFVLLCAVPVLFLRFQAHFCCMVVLLLSSLLLCCYVSSCFVVMFRVAVSLCFVLLCCCVSFDDLSIREKGKVYYPVCCSKVRRYCSCNFAFSFYCNCLFFNTIYTIYRKNGLNGGVVKQ